MFDFPRSKVGVKFPALEVIAIIHVILAILVFIGGIVSCAFALFEAEKNSNLIIGTLIWTALVPLLLWGSGEMIIVFLRIEENSRQTNYLLKTMINDGFGKTGQKLPVISKEKIQPPFIKSSSNQSINQLDDLDEKMEIARRMAKSQETNQTTSYFFLFYLVFFLALIIAVFIFLGRK
jgi:hypothetical protein